MLSNTVNTIPNTPEHNRDSSGPSGGDLEGSSQIGVDTTKIAHAHPMWERETRVQLWVLRRCASCRTAGARCRKTSRKYIPGATAASRRSASRASPAAQGFCRDTSKRGRNEKLHLRPVASARISLAIVLADAFPLQSHLHSLGQMKVSTRRFYAKRRIPKYIQNSYVWQ